VDECKPLHMGKDTPQFCYEIAPKVLIMGRGLHSFPFPLNLSLLCPFPLNLSSL
jgi:hypothetical protein